MPLTLPYSCYESLLIYVQISSGRHRQTIKVHDTHASRVSAARGNIITGSFDHTVSLGYAVTITHYSALTRQAPRP